MVSSNIVSVINKLSKIKLSISYLILGGGGEEGGGLKEF